MGGPLLLSEVNKRFGRKALGFAPPRECTADMLGVRREGITDAAGKLQKVDVIQMHSRSCALSPRLQPRVRAIPATKLWQTRLALLPSDNRDPQLQIPC